MRRSRALVPFAFTLAVALAAIAPAAAAPAPQPPRPELLDDLGDWTPPSDHVARAAELASKEGDALRAAIDALAASGDPTRVAVARAGLRLRDADAARICAAQLHWDEVDAWETKRIVDLWADRFAEPDALIDFEEFRSMVGGCDLERIFRNLPPLPWKEPPTTIIAHLHRQACADQLPLLCDLARSPIAEVGDTAWGNITTILPRTSRYLDDVGRVWLAFNPPPEEPAPAAPSEPAPSTQSQDEPRATPGRGLSTPLRRVIERLRIGSDFELEGFELGWQVRWLQVSHPGPDDAALLRGAAARYRDRGWKTPGSAMGRALVRSLRHVPDDETEALVRSFLVEPESDITRCVALATLATLGDADAAARLAEAARTDSGALALWMEAQPAEAQAYLESRFLGPAEADALRALLLWDDAEWAWWAMVLDWPERLFDRLPEKALAARLDPIRLLRITCVVPRCRTRAMAKAILDRLNAKAVLEWCRRSTEGDPVDEELDLYEDSSWVSEGLAFLEAAAPDLLRERLRKWSTSPDAEVRNLALRLLLQIGDPASGPRLTEWLAGMSERDRRDTEVFVFDAEPEVTLARSACPEARAFLLEEVTAKPVDEDGAPTSALVGLALLDLERLARPNADLAYLVMSLLDGRDVQGQPGSPGAEERRQLVLRGDARGALRHFLERATWVPEDLWLLDLPEVRAFLERMRDARAAESFPTAVAQLAAMGDGAARSECAALLRDWRYRWVDSVIEATPGIATFGYDLDTWVPVWIGELESSCCRAVCATYVLNALFATEFYEEYDYGRPPIDRWLRWWREMEGATFIPSRISSRWEPVF